MFTPRLEPGKWKALSLAVLVHVLLAIALVFGVQWRQQAPESMAVEVWRSVPNAAPTKATSEPPAEEAPPPPPPVKVEPRPTPKAEPRPEPKAPAKPDIAVKQEKDKKTKEPPKEAVKEVPKDSKKTDAKAEPRPSFDDALKREMAQLERQKSVQGERLRAEHESRQMAQLKADQASASRASGLASYTGKIRGKVRGNVVLPPNLVGNPTAVFMVTQLPSGEVVTVKKLKSSGVAGYDDAIERAILKSSPLPLPDDKSDFQRELKLTFCPQEDGAGCQR